MRRCEDEAIEMSEKRRSPIRPIICLIPMNRPPRSGQTRRVESPEDAAQSEPRHYLPIGAIRLRGCSRICELRREPAP